MSVTPDRSHRDTIFVEAAELIDVREYPSEQFILRIQAPKTASHAEAGQFVHITCDAALPMRRPLSIMRVNAEQGWVEILFKIEIPSLAALCRVPCGTPLDIMGPIGKPFVAHPNAPLHCWSCGGVGIPPMLYLAESLSADNAHDWQPMVFMGSEVPFPLTCIPATLALPNMPADATHALALVVEDWHIPSRLASLAGLEGAHRGYVTDLAAHWLAAQDASTLARCEIFSCGPTPMLAAVAKVAERFDIPCQVSLEEYMACAVGGCAGCVVEVKTPDGPAMKRVCVDGPVFDSRMVFR